MIKIGVFGGAFNPVHNGHINMVKEAFADLKLQKMLIIPTCVSPHKSNKGLIAFEDRAKMCGGIHVTSVQGSGSTFTVDLPFGKIKESGKPTRFSDINGRNDLAKDCYAVDYDFKGKRILLVEDNELNREIAEELIGVTGASVESAEDGVQAVEMFKESAEGYYDLILMDVQMPHMDGYEATRCIRALGRSDAQKVPIFAMTANAFAEDVQKSREAGMNAHISKPLNIRAVYKQMNRYLQG